MDLEDDPSATSFPLFLDIDQWYLLCNMNDFEEKNLNWGEN